MKNLKIKYIQFFALTAVLIANSGCERNLSDEAELSTFSKNPEVFIDAFSSGLQYFPFGGSKADAFTVDTETKYAGTASMRFDVPTFGNSYAGANFPVSTPRNLVGYDALTFWAKASKGATINEIGFGLDGDTDENKFRVTAKNLSIATNWVKYTIPIPDASKLTAEKGLFWIAEGAQFEGDEGGYTFWIDELKYEKLGTIGQPQPAILNGQDLSQQFFTGSEIPITGLQERLNLASGQNITLEVAPSYYDFISSDTNVATVSELGVVSIIGAGNAKITAKIADIPANGSLNITSVGALPSAPNPLIAAANVKSIFSDAFVPATPINYAPGFGGSTTQTNLVTTNNDDVLIYTNNNFTGIIFENTVNASALTFLHVDVYAQQAGVQVEFQIRDIGSNGVINTNIFTGQPELDDKDYRFTASNLTVNGWNSYNIPLAGNITNQKNNLGAIILAGGPNFILDNIYFYVP